MIFAANVRVPSTIFSIRLFIGLWFLSSFILMKTYGGVFYSVLTLPVYKDPIDTVEDLERVALNGEYDIVTYPKSYYYKFFVTAECCDAYFAIGQAMKNSKIEMPSNIETGIGFVEKSMTAKHMIFIMTIDSLTFGVRSFSSIEMHISSDVLLIDQLAMALQKRSPLYNSMEEM